MDKAPTPLSLSVREAVANAPGTLRALARAAGVPHTTLLRVGRGEIEASPALAESLATVLERWGEACKLHGFRVRQELYRAEREGRTAFEARRGGHAPAALRAAFDSWVRSGSPDAAPEWSLEAVLDVEGRAVAAEWLLGQLWNCTDGLPESACKTLSLPRGSTYARAVREVKRAVRQRGGSRPAARPSVEPPDRGRAQEGSSQGLEFQLYPEPFIGRLAPAEDEVHVWCLSLDVEDDVARRIGRCLSGEERRSIARLRFADHRKRRTMSRGVLRRLLAVYLDFPPDSLGFRDGPFGKPELAKPATGSPTPPPPTVTNISFNLSHSADMMLVAIAPTGRVGVDVERLRPVDQAHRIIRRYFSAREARAIDRAPEGQAVEAFLRAWTRKEAVAKAMGEGIVRSLGRLEVTVGPEEPTRLLAIDGDERRAATWSLHDLEPSEGYVGALACEGRAWRVRAWRAGVEVLLPDKSEAR